jgi:hypothetical protein
MKEAGVAALWPEDTYKNIKNQGKHCKKGRGRIEEA